MASNSIIKRLWNDRRGVSAWVVTIAMVPLLGMVSLGTEVGSWYVIRRHAQNAADAAAIAGATALAVNDPTGAVTAGQAFANSNGFATGKPICPPPTASTATTGQNVCITSSGTGAAGSTVTAIVTQYETPIFTQWFLPKGNSVPIQATAVATIQQKPGYCALALSQLTISGSSTLTGPCGLVSNGTVNPPPPGQNPFLGGPNNWTLVAANGCTGNANGCNLNGEVQSYSYSAQPTPLPPALDHLMTGGVVPPQPTGTINYSTLQPSPSTTTPPTWQPNGLYVPAGVTMNLPSGLYLFPGLKVDGTLTGTGVNIIIGSGGFGDSHSGNSAGTGSINMTAGTGGGLSDMNGVLIFDQETTSNVRFAGQFTSNFNGAIYFPYSHLTFRGGSGLTGCMVVVANVLDFGGNSSMDMSGCSDSVLSSIVPQANVVMLTN
jgi:Flp pilus assembly protein TadG